MKALITGATGQDGSYLSELLVSKGYQVHGTSRGGASVEPMLGRMRKLANQCENGASFQLHKLDLGHAQAVRSLVKLVQPDEVYHLAGQSHVGRSYEAPEETVEMVCAATTTLYESIRSLAAPVKVLNIGSAEVFGRAVGPQCTDDPFKPVSPYGAAKAFTVSMGRIYRETLGVFVCNAICYNHESERRPEKFVTRKITQAAARASLDPSYQFELGSLDVCRDWGYAPEYVEAMWRILQADYPDDFVLATGELTSLEEFLNHAFSFVDLNWRDHVLINQELKREGEPLSPVGDPSKVRKVLNWSARTSPKEIAEKMVLSDLARLSRAEQTVFQPEKLKQK